MKEKRKPLQKRMRSILMLLCAISVVVTGIISIVGMLLIQNRGNRELEDQAKLHLSGIITDKADLANAGFGRYADYISFLADYIHKIYQNADSYRSTGRDVPPPLKETPEGVYAMQRGLLTRDMTYEDVRDTTVLFSNLEDSLDTIMQENGAEIATIYAGFEEGLLLSYDAYSYSALPEPGETEMYFNFKERPWYQKVMAETGTVFTDVYTDDFGRGLNITCASPFYDANDQFAGVIAADILITNLYDSVVEMNLGEDTYTFMVDTGGNLISPDKAEATIYDDPDLDKETITEILAGETGIRKAKNGVFYAYTPVSSVGWELVVHMPQAVMLQPVNEMRRGLIFVLSAIVLVFLLVLIAVSLISRRISRRLTAPIQQLQQDAEQISGGNLEHRAEVPGNDEISDLADSFNDMAVSLKNHIQDLTKVTAEQERIRAELDVAAQIQTDMLPATFPAFPDHPEFDLFASMTPAREVSGDFYDYFLIDEDHLALVMADVSGKGVPAALFMTKSRNMIRSQAKPGLKPDEILARVNRQLCNENTAGLFVTVWLGILHLPTGELETANAGHEYPAVRHADGSFEFFRTENDLPLATEEGAQFHYEVLRLSPGDALFVYTDGVTDAKSESGLRYGKRRLQTTLNEAAPESSAELLYRIQKDVRVFAGTGRPFDDITMLSLIYLGNDSNATKEQK